MRQVHKLFYHSTSVLQLLCQSSSTIFVAGTASHEASTVAWGVTSKFAQWSPRNFPKCSVLQVSTCGFSCAGWTPDWLAVPKTFQLIAYQGSLFVFSLLEDCFKSLVVCHHMFPWSELYFFYDPDLCHFGSSKFLIWRIK